MSIKSTFQKFLLILTFIALLGAGYVTVSVLTACPAQAQACECDDQCNSAAGGVSVGFGILAGLMAGYVTEATEFISLHFTLAIEAFTQKVLEHIAEALKHFIDWFNTFWFYNLLPSMQAMTRELNVIDTEQARTLGSIADAATMNRLMRDYSERQLQSHREQRPSETGCVAATVMGGMTRAANIRRAYGAAAPAEQLPRSANAANTPAAGGVFADMKVRWDKYTERYCLKDYNNGHSGCTADKTFADQDIDVTGTVFLKDTIDITNEDVRKSIDDLLANIGEPFVKDVVPPTAVDSAGGREAILEGESYKAKRQAIHDALYYVIARRLPGSSMGPFVKALREAGGITATEISDNPSHNEILQAMIMERTGSGKYGLQQVGEPENDQREMVIQQALQMMIMNDQLDLMDHYSLILAAEVGAEIRAAKHLGTAAAGAPLK